MFAELEDTRDTLGTFLVGPRRRKRAQWMAYGKCITEFYIEAEH